MFKRFLNFIFFTKRGATLLFLLTIFSFHLSQIFYLYDFPFSVYKYCTNYVVTSILAYIFLGFFLVFTAVQLILVLKVCFVTHKWWGLKTITLRILIPFITTFLIYFLFIMVIMVFAQQLEMQFWHTDGPIYLDGPLRGNLPNNCFWPFNNPYKEMSRVQSIWN